MSEIRIHPDGSGPVVLMAEAKGYVMVRRPGKIPFVLSIREWLALPLPAHVQGDPS